MNELRRITLETPLNEASGLAQVRDPALLRGLDADAAWFVIHDEGTAHSMVSIVVRSRGAFSVVPFEVDAGRGTRLTDAEALTLDGDDVLIVGSGFIGPKNRVDERRSFIAKVRAPRAPEHRGQPAPIDIVELGASLMNGINHALEESDLDTMPLAKSVAKKMPTADTQPINIEGAAVVNDDLVLGLRWPVTQSGNPILAIVHAFRSLFAMPESPLRISLVSLPDVGSGKRPSGIRGLSSRPGPGSNPSVLHAIIGPTDRSIAAEKARASALEHIAIDLNNPATVESIRTFEGYRKIEGLAPCGNDWIYALDDEDAIVLLLLPDGPDHASSTD